jgi:acylglycerol lipase
LIRVAFLSLVIWIAACAPVPHPPGPSTQTPQISGKTFVAADGTRLPLKSWLPENSLPPVAVILALHGFNDYSNFFDDPGDFLTARGIASYAYDQRGFGAAPNRGTWAGAAAYVRDAADAMHALRRQYPKTPLYLLGSSMGGAVAMVALSASDEKLVDGLILAAPAVWGRVTMPWYQRVALWLGAHTVPWMTVTGQGLGIIPSDNYEMLVALGRDPLIIKETRIGTIYGLVNLMDAGLAAAPKLPAPALILYGEKDQIIPKLPTRRMLARVPSGARVALYEGGYHMLLRDLPAATVWKDIAHWITNRHGALPSGADARDIQRLLGEDQ